MKYEFIELRNGNRLKLPIVENYKDCFYLIKTDLFRLSGTEASMFDILKKMINPLKNNTLLWFRLCQYRGIFYYPCCLLYNLYCNIYNIDIPTTTKIGCGLYIGHGMCIVINGETIIGNNVNLSQFLCIGTNHRTPAKIGDNVYLGPHVSVVENVEIGNNVTIGAGAVVTKDIPENSTAVGVPAKVVNYNNPGIYVGRRWI